MVDGEQSKVHSWGAVILIFPKVSVVHRRRNSIRWAWVCWDRSVNNVNSGMTTDPGVAGWFLQNRQMGDVVTSRSFDTLQTH